MVVKNAVAIFLCTCTCSGDFGGMVAGPSEKAKELIYKVSNK